MSKSKKRVLAGIMSLLLIITSVFTGNVVTAKAQGLEIGSVENYTDGKYIVSTDTEQVEFSTVLIPDGCCFRVEKAITVSGAITVNPGGRLEVVGDGSITCGSFLVGASANGKDPSLFFDGTSNVPVIEETALDLYEPTDSGLSKVGEFEYFEFIYDYTESKWVWFNPYDAFGPNETYPTIVEVALLGYDRGAKEKFPISFDSVNDSNTIDGWDRMKVRVNGDSLTISWDSNATVQPTQICVQGAGENRDWLIYDVTGEETSYTINLNREKENGDPEDYYYIEVKYGLDSPSGDDITYDTTSTISSSLVANNVTISGDSTVITLNANIRLRIDGTLSVGGNAQLKGSDHTSVLELGNNASIEGIDVYNSAGTKLSNDSHRYTNSGEGAVEFEWDSTNGYWKLRSSQGNGGDSNDITYDTTSTISSSLVANNVTISGESTVVTLDANIRLRIDGTLSVGGTAQLKGSDHTSVLELGNNASIEGIDVYNSAGTKLSNDSHRYTNSGEGAVEFEWDSTNRYWKLRSSQGDGGNSDDITYNSDTSITSNLLKDNVTIDEGCTLTIDNCTLTIGRSLIVNNNANVVGTPGNSKLEFQPNASSNGIDLYNTQGREITDGQEVSFTNGSTTTVFTWNNSNKRWETEQAETGGNREIIGNETKNVVIKFWELKNGEYVQKDIFQFDRMGLNGKIFAAGELVDANYKVTNGGKESGTNTFFFKGDFLNKITTVKLISSFTETNGKKTGVTINESVSIAEGADYVFLNQQGEEEGRIKSPWRAELPATEGETEEYNFLITELQRCSIVWTGATEDNYHGYGPDAYVENGKVQLVSIMDGGTDLLANNWADASEDSYDLAKNEGYIFAPVGSTVTVRLVPDYGYQVIGATINGVQELTAGETVSTFSFEMPAVNVHFRGVFTPSTDKITTPASEVSSATIGDASNAASSGNLNLNVADNATYTKTEDAKTTALGGDTTKVATTVATLDMTLDNIVNKNAEDSYWTTSVTEFTSPITVGLTLNDVTLADGEELVVVREHNGTLEKIDTTYNATTGTLSVPTNRFSTYSIVKLSKKKVSDAVITFDQDSFTYDGTEKEPTIKIDGVALDSSKFTVTYTNSSTSDGSKAKIFAGTVTIRITAKADNPDYTGYKEKTYTIAKADPNIGTVSLDSNFGNIYTSTSVDSVSAALTRTDTKVPGTLELTDVTSFTKTGANNYNWKFTPNDTTNYDTKTGKVALTVLENTLSSLEVSGKLSKLEYQYGDEINLTGLTFTATFANGETMPVAINDKNFTYTATLAVGQTSLEVIYTNGGVSKKATVEGFTVVGKDIANAEVTLGDTLTYNGTTQTQSVSSVEIDGKALTEKTDYTITGNQQKDAGTYTLTITGTGNYTGTVTKEWTLAKATPTITLSNLSETTQAPTGVKTTISPEDATAKIVIEYQVELSANGQTTKQWVTTRPAVAGTYPVRAYLPEATTNLAAVAEADAVTGTYTLTQYTAPVEDANDTTDDSQTTDTTDTEETAENTTTSTPTKKPTTTTEESKPETTPESNTGVSSGDGSEGWKDIKVEINDKIAEAAANSTGEAANVVVEMNGEVTVPADVFATIKGQDITVTFDMGNGISWSVNGTDVTGESFSDINLAAETGAGVTEIPSELMSALTEDRISMELTLEYEGEFGFTAVMSVNVEKKNAGKYANLFYFNPKEKAMEFICAALVKEDGTTDLTFTHASDYVIVIDEVAMSVANNITQDKVIEEAAPQETPVEIEMTNTSNNSLIWILAIGIVILLGLGIAFLTLRKKND